jgi:hypothetical protein
VTESFQKYVPGSGSDTFKGGALKIGRSHIMSSRVTTRTMAEGVSLGEGGRRWGVGRFMEA